MQLREMVSTTLFCPLTLEQKYCTSQDIADQTLKKSIEQYVSFLAKSIRSGSLDLLYRDPITSPSALATQAINQVSYPEDNKNPNAELNNCEEGKIA